MDNYSQGYGFWDQYGNFWNGNQGMYQQGYGQGASYNGYNASNEINYVGNQGSYNFGPSHQFPNQFQNPYHPSFYNNQWNNPSGNGFQGGNYQGNFQQFQQGSSSIDDENNELIKRIMEKLDHLESCNAITLRSGKELPPTQVSEPIEEENVEEEIPTPKERVVEIPTPKKRVVEVAKPKIVEKNGLFESKLIARQKQRFMDIMDKVVVTLPLVEAIENSPTWSKFFNKPIKKEPTKGEQLVSIDTSDMLEGEMEEEVLMRDPLEVTLVLDKNEHRFLDQDARKYEDALDAIGDVEQEETLKVEQLPNDTWSELSAPKLELKPLTSDMDIEIPLKAHGNVIHQSHIDKVIWEENEKLLEELAKHLASPIEERVSKGRNVEDFPIIVDGCIVPMDLLVDDMVESKEQPFVLETPFLNTIGAKIDFVTKEVVLENADNGAFCPIKSPFSKSCEPITMEESSNLELKPPWDENLGDVESKHEREPPLAIKKKIVKKKKKTKARMEVVNRTLEQDTSHGTFTSSITLVQIELVDGKFGCKVKVRHGASPFAKARILLGSTSQAKKGHMLGEKMASLFTMRLVDLEPKPPDGPPPFNH